MYVVCACEHVCTFQMCVISQVQQQKRLQKAQENLMSEEEKKKRRKLQKVSLCINLKIGTSYISNDVYVCSYLINSNIKII